MSETAPRDKQGYIISPWIDNLHLIWSPMQWLCVGAAIYYLDIADLPVNFGETYLPVFPVFAMSFAVGHIFAGFFRFYANPTVIRAYPIRLIIVPALFLLGMNVSRTFFIFYAVSLVWFDIWHSSMQVFGLARLYDRAVGNDTNVGRKLDMGMALLTYGSAILAGVAFVRHVQRVPWLEEVGFNGATAIQMLALKNQSILSWLVAIFAVFYISFYIFMYWRYSKQGYRFSWQKVFTWVAMATCSVWTWGFDSFFQAFLIMECFHAHQYYALVWWSEGKRMQRLFRMENIPFGKQITFVVYMTFSIAGGFWSAVYAVGHFPTSIVLMVEGLHYWADGYTWSVRRKVAQGGLS